MLVQTELETRLTAALAPDFLTVANESHMHNVPPNSETHFKVVVASEAFNGRRKVQRHQQVYGLVGDLLAGPIHALALHTYTPEEWSARPESPDSPKCHGGEK